MSNLRNAIIWCIIRVGNKKLKSVLIKERAMKMIGNGFLRGYARVLDLMGVTKNWPDISNDRIRDYNALREDWENIGGTIQKEERSYKKAGAGCSRK